MPRNQRSTYRSARYPRRSSGDGFFHVLLFYILPFLVFNGILFYCVTSRPKASLVLADTNDYLTTTATLKVESMFPTKSIEISMEGTALEAEKKKGRTYLIPLSKNGMLEAKITNLNGMSTTVFESVNILDDNPPAIEDASIADGIVTLTVTDSQSGVNFDSIYAVNSAGTRLEPVAVDRSTCTLSYEMDPSGFHVYAQDKAGNEAQKTYTSRRDGDTETLDENSEEEGAAEGTEV